jgi:two-component system, LuxR family, response regulator FixJ
MMQGPTVFLVEDDSTERELLRRELEQQGFNCQLFENIHEFLASYDPSIPGCLILDIQLPDGNGIDLLREARRRGWQIPTIVSTAYGDVRSAVAVMHLGALDFLEKPYDPNILIAKIRQALDRDQTERKQAEELACIIQRFNGLTQREREVLGLLVAGKANKEIARILGITLKTVKNHREHIMLKVQAANTAELVRLTTEAGFASVGDLRQEIE